MTYADAIAHAVDDAAWAYVLRPITEALANAISALAAVGSAYLGVMTVVVPLGGTP